MGNKYNSDLCKLVIENIVQYENTSKVLEEVEEKLMESMDDEIQSFVEDNAKKCGLSLSKNDEMTSFSFSENSYHCFTSDEWTIDGSPVVSIIIDIDEDEGYHWLTHMCGQMSSNNYLAVWINIDRKLCGFTGKTGLATFKKTLSEQFEKHPELKESGFNIHGKGESIYMPFTFDLKAIADNYPDNLADAITPATDTLQVLFENIESIKKIVSYFCQLAKES